MEQQIRRLNHMTIWIKHGTHAYFFNDIQSKQASFNKLISTFDMECFEKKQLL